MISMATDWCWRFDYRSDFFFLNFSCFRHLMCCGNNDAELWSAALLESVIIPSGQSVWHSAVAFQSPPSSPLVRHSALPPPLAEAGQSEQTCPYLCSSPLCCFTRDYHHPSPPRKSEISLHADANSSTNESSGMPYFIWWIRIKGVLLMECKPGEMLCMKQGSCPQVLFAFQSYVQGRPLLLSVRGSCSAVLVRGPKMCHRLLRVTIILAVSWKNKGCEQAATHLVDFCWKNGFGTVLEQTNKSIYKLSLSSIGF